MLVESKVFSKRQTGAANTDHNKITKEGLPNQDITLTADFNQEQENGLLILNKHDGKVPGNAFSL